jgi:hypothetical protein
MRRGSRRIQPGTGIAYVVGKFCPELIGKVPGYPLTEEAYERQRARLAANRQKALEAGRLTRRGVPNGWAGRREEAETAQRNSQSDAERLAETIWEIADPHSNEHPYVIEAMSTALQVAMDPTTPASVRLKAWRLWLEFNMPRPTAREIMQADDPLAFLTAMADAAKARKTTARKVAAGGACDERKKCDE